MIIRPLHKTKGTVHTYNTCTVHVHLNGTQLHVMSSPLLTVKNFKYVHLYLYVNQCMNECMHVMCVCFIDYFSIHLTSGCFIITGYIRMILTVLRHEVRSHISFITLSISCNKLTLREVRKHTQNMYR